jgi:serine/threonine protein kinase
LEGSIDSRIVQLRLEELPYPLAAAWQRLEFAPGERVTRLNDCTERFLRLLAAILLADYVRGLPHTSVDSALADLATPSHGHWLGLVKLLRKALLERSSPRPFVPEALEWLDSAITLLDRLIRPRNDVGHGRLGDPDVWFETVLNPLRRSVLDANWLRSYRLFKVVSSKQVRGGVYRGKLSFLTGPALLPRDFEWAPDPLPDAVYLLSPDADRALEVSPFIQVHTFPGSGELYVYLLCAIKGMTLDLREPRHLVPLDSRLANERSLASLLEARPLEAATIEFHRPDPRLRHQEREGVYDDRYELGNRLGEGGMATVLAAEDLLLRRSVALKILKPSVDGEVRDRFIREARIMIAHRHPHVLEAYDLHSLADGRPTLVLQRANGSLADRIASGGLDEGATVDLARKLLSALAYLHGKDIVHRDVKPENILFDKQDEPRLADFGVARVDDDAKLTTAGAVIGTLAYMSPEQRRGLPIDSKTDIYSLALVLHQVRSGSRSPPERPGVGIDGWFGRWLSKLGRTDSADRPNAEEALALLDRWRRSPPAGAGLDFGEAYRPGYGPGILMRRLVQVPSDAGSPDHPGILGPIAPHIPVSAPLPNEALMLELLASHQATGDFGLAFESLLEHLSESGTGGRILHAIRESLRRPEQLPPQLERELELIRAMQYRPQTIERLRLLGRVLLHRIGLLDSARKAVGKDDEVLVQLKRPYYPDPGRLMEVLDTQERSALRSWIADRGVPAALDRSGRLYRILAAVSVGPREPASVVVRSDLALAEEKLWGGRSERDLHVQVAVADFLVGHTVGAVELPQPTPRFLWKGQPREIPSTIDDPVFDRAPDPDFARYLAGLTLGLDGMPTVPRYGYQAAAESQSTTVEEIIDRLKAVQRWCHSMRLFDLSAIIVRKDSLVPGAGNYGIECRDTAEWRTYMSLAIEALRRQR